MKAKWNFIISLIILTAIFLIINFNFFNLNYSFIPKDKTQLFIIIAYIYGVFQIGIGLGKILKYCNDEKR